MEINLQNNDDFDNFFKKKYADDFIKPSLELWENINQKMKFRHISSNYRNISMLKIAIALLSIAMISTFVHFEISMQHKKMENIKRDNSINNKAVMTKNDSIDTLFYNNNNRVLVKSNNIEGKMLDENKNNIINNTTSEILKNIEMNINITRTISKNNQGNAEKNNPTEKETIAYNNTNKNKNGYGNQNRAKIDDTLTNDRTITVNKTSRNNIKHNNKHKISVNDSLINASTTVKINNLKYAEVVKKNKKRNLNKGIESKSLRGKFSISIYATPQYSFRTVYDNSSYAVRDMGKTYFNKHEKGSFGFSTGLQLFYTFNSRWKISGGIEYVRHIQHMEINGFDLKTDNQNGYYAYSSIGRDDLAINSSLPINDSGFLKSYRNYSFINIPVSVEYSLIDNFFITVGLSYNFLVSTDINWQAEDYGGDFSITTGNIAGIKTNSFSFIIGAGYEKSLSSKFSLVINPQFTTFITSITKEMPVKTYPFTFGLKVIVRYYP